jgi:hypothetical protein
MRRHKSVASDDLFPEGVDSLRLAARCNAQARFAFFDDHPAAFAHYDVRNLVELLRPSSAASVS